jgi:exopolysaccharide biosynthesis WecB/TagA/CpsF family protein
MLRLLPELVVFLLVLSAVAAPLLKQPLAGAAALAALLYVTNYLVIFAPTACDHCAVTGHLWSLAVEEHFYLLAPLGMVLVGFRRERLVALFGGVIFAALAWRSFAVLGLHLSEAYASTASECRMDSIAWGCLAALLFTSEGVSLTPQRWALPAFMLGAMLLVVSLVVRDETFRASLRYALQGAAFLLLVPPLVSAKTLRPLRRLLEAPALRWMGRRSYGAYLWHYVALAVAAELLGVKSGFENAALASRLEAIPVVMGLVWILAALSARLVFMPAQSLKPLLEPRASGPAGRLFGFAISRLTRSEQVAALLQSPAVGGGVRLVVTMNLDHVVRLRRTPEFRDAYGRAAVVTLDGAPVWLYGAVRGVGAPRCTGADMFADLETALRPSDHRPFFVLSSAPTAEGLTARLCARGFSTSSLGFAVPPFGFETDEAASFALAAAIRAHRATHLVMGLGAPKSELFVDRFRDSLGDLHALCVGSAPDFVVGVRRRAPPILRRMGLEWLWRALEEPKRLLRRYFLDSWSFIPAVFDDLKAAGRTPLGDN